MRECKLDLSNKIIYCIYEGNAELEILNTLIDNNRLIFTRDDLLDNKFHRRASGKNIAKKLNRKFNKKVVIVRVLDSTKEKLRLPRLYKEMYTDIINCYTCPEIEILIILHHNDLRDFNHEKTLKPSEYCKKNYGYSKSKAKEYFINNFTVDEIISMLKKYHSQHSDQCYSLYSLVRQ